jgi:hypothetical protein
MLCRGGQGKRVQSLSHGASARSAQAIGTHRVLNAAVCGCCRNQAGVRGPLRPGPGAATADTLDCTPGAEHEEVARAKYNVLRRVPIRYHRRMTTFDPNAADEVARYPYWQANLRALTVANFLCSLGFALSWPFLPLMVRELVSNCKSHWNI